jgi:hypothetical protein
VRKPIHIDTAPVRLDEYEDRIAEVREAFTQYLTHYIPKSSASKYGVMGPVGKILSEAKSGRANPEYLKGYVLRVHELSQRGAPSPDAINALENGIDALAALLDELPVAARDKLIDRLDYGLYFALRKKFVLWLAGRDAEYQAFLQQKYPELSGLSAAWGRKVNAADSIRYGGPSSRTYKQASPQERADLEEFAQRLKTAGKGDLAEVATEEESA